jgi:hypothetical protein
LIRFYDNSKLGSSRSLADLEKYGKLYSKNRYPLFYQRATTYPPGTTVYSHKNNGDYTSFLTSKAWSLGESAKFKPKIKPENYATMLVSGFQVSYKYLDDLLSKEITGKFRKCYNIGQQTIVALGQAGKTGKTYAFVLKIRNVVSLSGQNGNFYHKNVADNTNMLEQYKIWSF